VTLSTLFGFSSANYVSEFYMVSLPWAQREREKTFLLLSLPPFGSVVDVLRLSEGFWEGGEG